MYRNRRNIGRLRRRIVSQRQKKSRYSVQSAELQKIRHHALPADSRLDSLCHAVSTPSPALRQASKPPMTLITFSTPARRSRLHAIMLRYPPWQWTATGTDGSISGAETLKLSSGNHSAPSMCPPATRLRGGHPAPEIADHVAVRDNSCTVICGRAARRKARPASTRQCHLAKSRGDLQCQRAPGEAALPHIAQAYPQPARDERLDPMMAPAHDANWPDERDVDRAGHVRGSKIGVGTDVEHKDSLLQQLF